MKNSLNDDRLVSQFLLGQVSEEQKAQLEELFFNDDEYFDYMLALEDELIDDYAQGALSARDRRLFETYFLNSPERRSRLEFAQALQKTAALAAPEMATAQSESKPWWQALLGLLGLQNPVLQLALGAAAIVLLLGSSWLIFESARLRNQLAQAEAARYEKEREAAEQAARQREQTAVLTSNLERERQEREELERQLAEEKERRDKGQTVGAGLLASFVLSAGLMRDEQGAKRLMIPATAEQVRLQLNIRRTGEYKAYRAALQTLDGVPVRTQAARPVGGSGKAVAVNLLAGLLKPGDYKLALTGLTEAGSYEEIDNYYFSVIKK